ncbi:MAG: aldehyde dehydrogenase family protein [Proteobacteria bacterium]|nr:aldehyde dehydrogenase family protein [Pseudomonadota bacterium]MCZ6879586.1 aldehyde dehydrogenase family protein [Gammaproteobacteria bacterium]
MSEHFALLVPGAKAEGEPLTVNAPFDNQAIATVERGGRQAVEQAMATAYSLYRNRDGWLSPARRIEILKKTADLLYRQREFLATESAREGGKPLPDSLVEIDRAVDSFRSCVDHLRVQAGNCIPMDITPSSANRLAFTIHEPIGVVLAFSAFNHPLNLIAHQIGPAIAAGCPVIVKPAEATPLSCMRIVAIVREAGLPEDWCQALVTTGRDVSMAMATDPRVAFFSFIGSSKVGWMLRSKLAPGTRCALEHGGAAPAIVMADADLEQVVPLLCKGGMYHAGQVCVSVQRIFAHSVIIDKLAKQLAQACDGLKVGDPTLAETEVGPLIREAEVQRVDAWVREAIDGGASLLCGGKILSATTYQPTVLLNPPADVRVSTQEIFGPVVCLYGFADVDDAIARANSLPFSFQASVFTQDIDSALRVSRRIDAASVMINDHTAFRVDWMPFAGFKESGYGVGGIPYTLKDMQVEKQIIIKSAEI